MLADEVHAVFVDVLPLEGGEPRDSLVYNQTTGWDSIGHMTLVAALETTFNCMLDTDEILDMSHFGKAVEIVARHVDAEA